MTHMIRVEGERDRKSALHEEEEQVKVVDNRTNTCIRGRGRGMVPLKDKRLEVRGKG